MSDVDVTPENAEQLRALCDELGFSGFDDELRTVLRRGANLTAGKELVGVRSRIDRHDVLLEEQQRRVLDLERHLQEARALPQRVEQRLEAMTRAFDEVQRRALELETQLQEFRALTQKVEAVERRLDATARALDELQHRGASDDVESLRREMRALSDEVSRLRELEAKRATTPQAPRAEVVAPTPKPTTPARNEFAYDPSRPLDGIIAHLTRECGGNVHDKGVVTVTSSGCDNELCHPKNAADFGSNSTFEAAQNPSQWICYDFRGQRVSLTSYSIRSTMGARLRAPRSWVLEVSNDGSECSWVVVDSREDNRSLRGNQATNNFAISAPPSGAFRFVRLRLTYHRCSMTNALWITGLELFGTLSSE